MGRIDRALEDFDHPATRRAFHWDLARCGEVVASLLMTLMTRLSGTWFRACWIAT
jgi:Ser/Thr protein kinase RdoA (MazF antagonist)